MRTFAILEEEFIISSKEAYLKQSLNEARKAAEAFTKLVILKEFGDTEGDKILTGQNTIIQSYSFENAINAILFKNKIRYNQPLIHKKVKSYLQVLHNHGNLGSHNDDYSKLDLDETEYALYHLTKLIKFLYEEYLHRTIPNELEFLLIEDEKNLHEKIEQKNSSWLTIQGDTNNFTNQQQRFLLITDKCDNIPVLSNLSNISWSYIGDFDKDSSTSGLYLNLKEELGQYKDINLITVNDKLTYSKSTTF